ncbi:MAG TPA: hypothetical protein VJH91_00795, partial [Candidatus Paceibacterota bacterium]
MNIRKVIAAITTPAIIVVSTLQVLLVAPAPVFAVTTDVYVLISGTSFTVPGATGSVTLKAWAVGAGGGGGGV